MNRERLERIQEVLLSVLETPPPDRARVLDAACEGDPELHREVESLLRAHATRGPVDRLADTLGTGALLDLVEGGGAEGGSIGGYRVGAQLGRGGMSVVFGGWDPTLERPVALKLLPALLSADDASRGRLLAEARLAAQLEHPNICTIHEIGEADDGRLFIAMPLYEGETLRERLRAGPLPEAEALGLAEQVARALAAAHERGVIHRDIKPGNLMITRDGVVKVLDFGIARLDGSGPGSDMAHGTVYYMSPEQLEGRPATPRSDLWSLGVVLYEVLSGRRPFQADSREATGRAVREARPAPLGRFCPGVSPGTVALVESLLEPEPSERPSAASPVADALQRLRTAHDSESRPTDRDEAGEAWGRPHARGRRTSAAVTGGAVIIVATLATWSIMRLAAGPTPSEVTAPALPSTANPEAREYYLSGQALLVDPLAAPGVGGDAEWMFLQAVELDSTYAEAWAALAQLRSGAVNGRDAPVVSIHRRPPPPGDGAVTAELALAFAERFGAGLAETAIARAWYAFNVERDDASALARFREALVTRPGDPDALFGMGMVHISRGEWEDGIALMEDAHRADPDGYWRATVLGQMYAAVRRYGDARRLFEAALRSAPTYSEAHLGLALAGLQAEGDIDGAVRLLDEAVRHVGRADLFTRLVQPAGRYPFVRVLAPYLDGWLSDPDVAEQARARCPGCYWHARAQIASRLGEPDRAAVYYDSAFATVVPEPGSAPRSYGYAAVWAAGLGRVDDALRYADSTIARGPMLAEDVISGYHRLLGLAEVWARTGEIDRAAAAIEELLRAPGQLSPAIVRLDPVWEPLRRDPAFDEMLLQVDRARDAVATKSRRRISSTPRF